MTNSSLTFINKLKEATHELHLIQEEMESNIKATKTESKENLEILKVTIEKIKIHLIKILESHIKNCDNEKIVDSFLLNIDKIKPFFEEVLDKLKTPSQIISDKIDIITLKIKLKSIYARIFISEQKNNISHVIEVNKEKLNY
ncbi:hypothetical protein [Fluviispira sanaruensis]|uniref:Uncharacterized protein n=1 Tax=Fluviispira sanaruensis TaxID=2493639 RepID=A0A4P2VVW2_FLUSA|nr:hypothetical protein [Fluviispira sanaruensis]BBH53072.1 hypothetical protein JCM31447_15150 [Fluviispira sanaruensis]